MSSSQHASDFKGRITHVWQTDLWSKIIERNPIKKSKAAIEKSAYSASPVELVAGQIALETYEGTTLELGNSTVKILADIARSAVSHIADEKDYLVQYQGEPKFLVPQTYSVAILARVFDLGVTPLALLEKGITPAFVVQLLWWQKREDETLLEQQVRAELAGWCLPAVAVGYRDIWGNLMRAISKSTGVEVFLEKYASELKEIKEVLEFFAD
jgi:hypothetical protein